ncbi:MAG: alanine dehydrogenase [Bacteroidales bacterium]|jgi:alanine dehydrogenase|nr:alanine dehydrogenase [Bacteroidales bacterium]
MPNVYFSMDKQALMPQEKTLLTTNKQRSLTIGVPKETDDCENRIVLTPETAHNLVNQGHQILVESDAGIGCGYSNLQYSEMGAYIVDRTEVYQTDILLKINPPLLKEIQLMKKKQVLFSFLPPFQLNEEYINQLMSKQITALSFDTIKDHSGCYPLVRSMSEIAGTLAIQLASKYMGLAAEGKGILLGGISGVNPAEVVIIGAGVAAEFSARAALGMGAFVRIFDNSVRRLQRIQEHLGQRLYTSVLHPQILNRALASADALIGATHQQATHSGYLISEDMVATMKKGAVIVDLSINHGGCCETSEICNLKRPTVSKHGVIHYGVPNITSLVPQTAAIAISNIVSNIITDMAAQGSIANWLRINTNLRNGVYLFNGILTDATIGDLLGMPSKDINLLMVAF